MNLLESFHKTKLLFNRVNNKLVLGKDQDEYHLLVQYEEIDSLSFNNELNKTKSLDNNYWGGGICYIKLSQIICNCYI